MQAIIRFSIDGEKNGALRNKLKAGLEQAGFVHAGNTATYRHNNIDPNQLSTALGAFWGAASGHKGNGKVDHFWMYADRGFLDDLFPIDAGAGP